jgi:hypothetical protein
LFVARWWLSLAEHAGAFGAEFRQLRLGKVLGVAAAAVISASLFTTLAQLGPQPLVDDVGRLFMGALTVVGLAAAHRAVAEGKLAQLWLWVTYAALLLVAPLAVVVLAAWGFVHNWFWSARISPAVGRR